MFFIKIDEDSEYKPTKLTLNVIRFITSLVQLISNTEKAVYFMFVYNWTNKRFY